MKFEEKRVIENTKAERIKHCLTIRPQEGEKYPNFIETIHFPNGVKMIVECCGNGERDSIWSWTEAVLYQNEEEIARTSYVSDEFFGDWELEDDNGNVYIVHMIENETKKRANDKFIKI